MHRVLAAIVLFTTPFSYGGLVLELQDAISVPNQPTRLVAELCRAHTLSLRDGKERVPVEFFLGSRSLGVSRTDGDGFAVLFTSATTDAPHAMYRAQAVYKHRHLVATGHWFTWSRTRTVVAIDVDDTISDTNYSDLFISDLDHVSPVIDGAPAALHEMSRKFHLLYFSVRPLWLTAKTRAWLYANGFPPGPVAHIGSWDSCLQQTKAKKKLLASMRAQLPNLLIGIGDRTVDVEAYRSSGMLTLLVRSKPLNMSTQRVVIFRDWRSLCSYVSPRATLFNDATILAQAIHRDQIPSPYDSYDVLAPQEIEADVGASLLTSAE